MALEKLIEDLIAALNENTAAHTKMTDVAKAAVAAKGADKPAAAEKAPAKAPAKKAEADEPEEKPAAKKAPAKKAPAKKKGPELVLKVKAADIADIAVTFMGTDDEEEREDRKTKMRSALQHLGFKKATEIDNAEDRAKFASYLAFWSAGEEVDFEDIDEKVADALGGDDEDEDEDDMV